MPCVVLFLKLVTGCLVIMNVVKSMEQVGGSRTLITNVKVLTKGETKFLKPDSIVIGRTSQLILSGRNISSKIEVALTNRPNTPGAPCATPLVQLTDNYIKCTGSCQVKKLVVYLTAKKSRLLKGEDNVWLCARSIDSANIKNNAFEVPKQPRWTHQGFALKLKVLHLKDRSSTRRIRRHTVIDESSASPPPPSDKNGAEPRSPLSPLSRQSEAAELSAIQSEVGGSEEEIPLRADRTLRESSGSTDSSPFPLSSPSAPAEESKSGRQAQDTRSKLIHHGNPSKPNSEAPFVQKDGHLHAKRPKTKHHSEKPANDNEIPQSVYSGKFSHSAETKFLVGDEGTTTTADFPKEDGDIAHEKVTADALHADPGSPGELDRRTEDLASPDEGSSGSSIVLWPPLSLTLDEAAASSEPFGQTVRVSGIRVEDHPKGFEYKDGVIKFQAYYEAKLRLFGDGLTDTMYVQFTAAEGSYGDSCDVSTSQTFKVERANYTWAVVTVVLPEMSWDQDSWFICLREDLDVPAVHQGEEDWLAIITYSLPLPLWVQIVVLIILLILSGLFSGLNLGLMALDKTELEIVSNTGKPTERRYAKSIAPVRRHGNFLLCTLLLGNVLVNSTLTILLDNLSSGLIAIIGSTTGIVIFGEIVPQAICSRHGLAIGAKTVWLVRVFMVLTGLVAWPISKILDWVLGEELGNTYDRERLKELIRVTQDRNDIRKEEQNIICGALELHKKNVAEVMTRLEDVFMLPVDTTLDFNTISEIMQQGYSRIPIYEGERNNIVSVLFIKDLAFIDPDDNTPLRTLSQFYQNPCNFVFEDTTLDIMFKEFKEGNKGHMAFVQSVNNEGDCDPFYEILGLVTLEDVIEELIQEEIVDETDVITDNRTRRRRKDHKQKDFKEFSQINSHPHQKRVQISPQMQVAALQFLRTSVEPFKEGNLSESILKKMLTQDIIHILKPQQEKEASQNFIYVQGKSVDFFVLILEGHVEVTIGKESMTFDSGPFTFFGLSALNINSGIGESPSSSIQLNRGSIQSLESNKMSFTPDYSVKVVNEVTFVKVRRQHYIAARRAYLLQQSQRDPQAEDNFEKEMIKILKDEGLTSPVWENSTVSEPGPTDLLLNGRAIRTRSQEESLEMSVGVNDDLGSRGSNRKSKRKSKGENLSTPASPSGNSRSLGVADSCDDLTSLTSTQKEEEDS